MMNLLACRLEVDVPVMDLCDPEVQIRGKINCVLCPILVCPGIHLQIGMN